LISSLSASFANSASLFTSTTGTFSPFLVGDAVVLTGSGTTTGVGSSTGFSRLDVPPSRSSLSFSFLASASFMSNMRLITSKA